MSTPAEFRVDTAALSDQLVSGAIRVMFDAAEDPGSVTLVEAEGGRPAQLVFEDPGAVLSEYGAPDVMPAPWAHRLLGLAGGGLHG